MVLRETPPGWRRGFDLYRRRTERAMLGLGLRRVYSSPDGYESAGEGAYTKTFRFGRKVDKRFFCATADE